MEERGQGGEEAATYEGGEWETEDEAGATRKVGMSHAVGEGSGRA